MDGRSTILSFLRHPATIGLLTIPLALIANACSDQGGTQASAGAPAAAGASGQGTATGGTGNPGGGASNTGGTFSTAGAPGNGGIFMPVGGAATVVTVECTGGFPTD